MQLDSAPCNVPDAVLEAVRQIWGFDSLRPLQHEAIRAALERRDSLVVMPTGGGKSLCYQVPPLVRSGVDVVVSPLISLMKDQVDGLQACGYAAAALHSNLKPGEARQVYERLRDRQLRLLFVSPERLMTPDFLGLVGRVQVGAFAIDEAHCISHWGHDFRQEYRQLATLRKRFPGASIHAYTATATPRVREDIVKQLALRDPVQLVGRFDRPNLAYRIVPRTDVQAQVLDVVSRHQREATIVYCLTRDDTESLAAALRQAGVDAQAYHAGLPPGQRRTVQEDFATERLDVVVATVAFGMGIDRSNVRCVVHAAMPKSVEHYQQETGRAGRDGLEAECVLLYSAADPIRWRGLIERSAAGAGEHARGVSAAGLELLGHMQGICTTLQCRHRALSLYFGQAYETEGCGACDVCLGEVEPMADSTVLAQKILSCVARLGQRYGIAYVASILRGADTAQIRARGDDRLSTYGLLRELPLKAITNLTYQLIDQGLLTRTAGDRPVLQLNQASLAVLRGQQEARLLEPLARRAKRTKPRGDDWEGVDEGLFEQLRQLRREIAEERSVPAYVIFGDATLRALARDRPRSVPALAAVHGVGAKKLADLGPRFLEAICAYCDEHLA